MKLEEAVFGSFVSGILEADGIALQAGGKLLSAGRLLKDGRKQLTESCMIFLKVLSSGVPTTLIIAFS